MPAFDSEIESNPPYPKKPFVAVSRDGKLLPETKDVIAAVAKYDLILASGHIAPEEASMVFREARAQGVHHMIATHAMDLAGKMNWIRCWKPQNLARSLSSTLEISGTRTVCG